MESNRNVDVLVGGQWGSEGKGNIVSRIAHKYDVLVRTGGPNAGHQVVTYQDADSQFKLTFRHLPSGAAHNKMARLILGAGAVIHPETLFREMEQASIDPKRLCIHPNAAVIWDADRETDGQRFRSISTTGQGVGSATIRKISRDATTYTLARDEMLLRPYIWSEAIEGDRILVEGTQGTLLSLHHGSWPYVTSRDTTAAGFLSEAGIGPTRVKRVIMVCRTYPIRVAGPSGPMARETTWQQVAVQSGKYTADQLMQAEITSTTKRQRRVAEFSHADFVHALTLNEPTDIALTFCDYLQPPALRELRDAIETFCRVSMMSFGPSPADIEWNNQDSW